MANHLPSKHQLREKTEISARNAVAAVQMQSMSLHPCLAAVQNQQASRLNQPITVIQAGALLGWFRHFGIYGQPAFADLALRRPPS